MRFSSIREVRSNPKKVWEKLKDSGELILTSHGKPIALMLPVDEDSFEDVLYAVRYALSKNAVSNMRNLSIKRKSHRLSLDEINKEILFARKEKSTS